MLQTEDREYLLKSLGWMRQQAPVLHISFSTDPSAAFMERLTTWLRQNISPFVLVQVGLHPNIGAGCVVRTTNKYFDFSLRQRFLSQRELLMQQLIAGAPKVEVVEPSA
jgi:F0F1-type ATP synthase delta subunit